MKQFNDSVVYVRNGKNVPAIVLKSQVTADGELLSLLYADPDKGPGLVAQGTFRGIDLVAAGVAPMAEGKVFAGSADRFLYAMDSATGEVVWRARTRAAVVGSPLYWEGAVYFGGMDGAFRCVSAADGSRVWQVIEKGAVSGSPALADDTLYYGDEAGNVLARGTDGKPVWNRQVRGRVIAAPCVTGDLLLLPVMSPTALSPPKIPCLIAYDRSDGKVLWSYVKESSVLQTPVADDQFVYCATVTGYLSETVLFAFRLSDGKEAWKRKLGGVADSSPILVGPYLLFGNHDRKFYVVDKRNGQVAHAVDIGAKMFSSPAFSNGRVYIGAQDGQLHCLQ